MPVVPATFGDIPGSCRRKRPPQTSHRLPGIPEGIFAGEASERRVFITSLDLRTVRIYPLSLWKSNESLLEQDTEDPDSAADVAFLAKDLGGSSELDAQGRVLVPVELRQLLEFGIAAGVPRLLQGPHQRSHGSAVQGKAGRARENVLEKLSRLEKKGLR